MILAAHVHAQGFGNADGAILLQVILQEGNEHPGRRHHGVVQGVGEVLLPVLALDANQMCIRDRARASSIMSMISWYMEV